MTGSSNYGLDQTSNLTITNTSSTFGSSDFFTTTGIVSTDNYSYMSLNDFGYIKHPKVDCDSKPIEVGDRVLYLKKGKIVEGNIIKFTDKVVMMKDGFWIPLDAMDKIYKL